MQKGESGEVEGFYDDGMFYLFDDFENGVKPKHITMEVLTTNNQIEVCDVRLTTLKEVNEAEEKKKQEAAAAEAASAENFDENNPQNN